MKFSAVAVAALVAGASAHYNDTVPVYTTEVVTAYTTYCPAPTQITHGTKTYTVTEATTLTITDCPCTVTKPIYSSTPAPSLPPVVSTPGPYPNATAPVPSAPPVASTPSAGPPASTPVASSPPIATGAAAKAFAASGAGLAGAFGVLAYLL